MEIANDIIKQLNKDIVISHELLHIGASIGISMYPQDSMDMETLIKYADKMMYLSKENGKNQVSLYKENKNV